MFVVRTLLRDVRCVQRVTPARCLSTVVPRRLHSLDKRLLRALRQPHIHLTSAASQWSSSNVVTSPYPDEPLPQVGFHEYLWYKIDKWPDATAVICGVSGRKISYKEIRRQCRNFGASLLRDVGLKKDDRIGILLPNVPEFIPAAFGAMEAGIIPTPMNPSYTPDEVAHQLKDSEATAAITMPALVHTLQKAVKIAGIDNFKIIVTHQEGKELPPGVLLLQDLLADGDTSKLQGVKRTPEDIAVLPYSSGTTGRPKGVVLVNRNITANLYALNRKQDHLDRTDTWREVVPLILPMFHIYGLAMASLTLHTGGEVILLPRFEETSLLNSLKEATILYVAPPLVLYLGVSPKITTETLKTVKRVVSGAAPVAGTDIERLTKKLKPDANYKQGYGLTETSPLVCSMHNEEVNEVTVGPPAINTKVKVIDPETSQALGPNEPGEIVVNGPQVMKEYWKNKKATEEVLKDGWFYTGDIGYYDSKGYFYITDRLKELIKVKGFQVAPAELEGVLRSHPDVADAGVVAAPDPIKGEKPVAFVALKPGSPEDPQSLKTFIQEKLAKFKWVDDFIFVESIPKSAAGKILRKELKKIVAEKFPKPA